jgi:hypothetical protein
LSSCIPNLQLASPSAQLDHLEAEVNSNGGQVVLGKVIIAVSYEEGRLSHSLVAHNDDLEEEVLLLDHSIDLNCRIID